MKRIYTRALLATLLTACSTPKFIADDEQLYTGIKDIEFVESKGWYFGGGFREIVDGYYVNPDGTKGKFVVDKE